MAIFKVVLLALTPFYVMPFVSGEIQIQSPVANTSIKADYAGKLPLPGLANSNQTVVFKNEAVVSDVSGKSSLPAKPIPQAALSARQTFNQSIAVL